MADTSNVRTRGGDDLLSRRLQSLDAYRGLIMVALAFNGFGMAKTAALMLKGNPDSGFWSAVLHQFSHVEWVGCAFWDLIQPSFMFMVGVSMAYSYVNRKKRGDSYRRMLAHAFTRAAVLTLLAVFLSSAWARQTNWSFTNVLAQIGLGYGFLFLLWGKSFRVQAITAACLLALTWVLFVAYPTDGIDPDTGSEAVGVSAEWAQGHHRDVSESWHKNANVFPRAGSPVSQPVPPGEAVQIQSRGLPDSEFCPCAGDDDFRADGR